MNSESVSGYIFILPFVIGFLVFTVFPMLASLVLSFTDYDMLSAPVFVGLKNYKQMFTQDPLIYKTLFNTFYFTITSVPLKLAFALMVAMLLVNTNKITSIYRAMFYLPSMVGGSVAIAVLWRRMFAGDGLVNALLGAVGLPDDVYWLGNENTAIWTLIILAVWQFGSPMLIFVAGLKQIPSSLYEAATVDGAGPIRKFFTEKPVVLVNVSGGCVDLRQADERCAAILQCFYPGAEGGNALADILFGRVSPSGRLPVTFYRTVEDLPPFTDYSMKGRTYRFFDGKPLYPFGHGLTYADIKEQWTDPYTVRVKNASETATGYTQEELTCKAHNYELVKSGNTVFCLDYAQNGIGSNSCGQELLPQYRLDEEKMQFGFTIRFLSSENKQ